MGFTDRKKILVQAGSDRKLRPNDRKLTFAPEVSEKCGWNFSAFPDCLLLLINKWIESEINYNFRMKKIKIVYKLLTIIKDTKI